MENQETSRLPLFSQMLSYPGLSQVTFVLKRSINKSFGYMKIYQQIPIGLLDEVEDMKQKTRTSAHVSLGLQTPSEKVPLTS